MLRPPKMILFGGCVTARQLISLSGQLMVYTVLLVRASQILTIPEISQEIIYCVPGIHFTPTKLWLWPFNLKI
jgi:hypothetical protein